MSSGKGQDWNQVEWCREMWTSSPGRALEVEREGSVGESTRVVTKNGEGRETTGWVRRRSKKNDGDQEESRVFDSVGPSIRIFSLSFFPSSLTLLLDRCSVFS